MDGGLDPWLDELWPKIMTKYPLPPGMQVIPADVQYPFMCEILLFRSLYEHLMPNVKC